jgi:hypothetical protein
MTISDPDLLRDRNDLALARPVFGLEKIQGLLVPVRDSGVPLDAKFHPVGWGFASSPPFAKRWLGLWLIHRTMLSELRVHHRL